MLVQAQDRCLPQEPNMVPQVMDKIKKGLGNAADAITSGNARLKVFPAN